MGGYENFWEGSDYGLDPSVGSTTYNESSGYVNPEGKPIPTSEIGFTHDGRSANILKTVSDKLNTGSSTIEVQGIDMAQLDYTPKQQWKELNRLKQLTGVDFTFHGPLVEATGVTKQGWDESQRIHAEEEMYSAIERAQEMEKDGNLVVTFHSSNGLPDPVVKQKMVNPETGKEEEIVQSMFFVDEKTGNFQAVAPSTRDYLNEGPDAIKKGIKEEVEKQSKESWSKQLQSVSFHANNGHDIINRSIREKDDEFPEDNVPTESVLDYYKLSVKNPEAAKAMYDKLDPKNQKILRSVSDSMVHGDLYLRDAYNDLQNLFNQAYDAAKKQGNHSDLKKLDSFRSNASKQMKEYSDDPSKVMEFGRLIVDGVNTLRNIDAPQTITPLRDWAIDKGSDTFGNVAFRGYKEFAHGKDKNAAPVISIENPPAGSGLHRGEDLKDLVEASQDKFVKRAVDELGMSESKARKEAEKLIGVTWDVGHINMIRKFGYDEDDLLKETEAVAKHVKHVHLSDNFGMQHTELPMGMGNVPTKKHLELIDKFNKQKNKIKKIVETGGWYQHFQVTPFKETMEAFGSPIYAMKMGAQWSNSNSQHGSYFSGFGTNPDIHHSIYGMGYSQLPAELGGQMQGGTNRFSGAPM